MNIYYILLLVLFIVSIWLKVTRSKRLGSRGEFSISLMLSKLDSDKYIVMNDLMLDTKYGTTQIDHVVLSVYGIFVIETKNYSGLIYGGERSDTWTKNMYGNKYDFKNPIKQNYGHIKALSEKLNIPSNYFNSIVVFTNRAKLKGDFESPVIYSSQLLDEIRYHNTEKLTKEQIIEFRNKLVSSLNYDKEKQKKHVADIKDNVNRKEASISAGICPKCGGKLVKRNGKYGEFYGCSNYPKCKFIYK